MMIFLLDKWQLGLGLTGNTAAESWMQTLLKKWMEILQHETDNENIREQTQVHTPMWSSGFWLQGIKQTIKLINKKKVT